MSRLDAIPLAGTLIAAGLLGFSLGLNRGQWRASATSFVLAMGVALVALLL